MSLLDLQRERIWNGCSLTPDADDSEEAVTRLAREAVECPVLTLEGMPLKDWRSAIIFREDSGRESIGCFAAE